MPKIDITISNDGEVQVEAQGVQGSGCQALTKAIEQAIGSTTGDRKKPEFAQQAAAAQGAKASH